MTAKAEVYRDAAGEWRWRLKAANGEVVASGEGYTSKRDAVRGWHDARKAVFGSSTIPAETELSDEGNEQ